MPLLTAKQEAFLRVYRKGRSVKRATQNAAVGVPANISVGSVSELWASWILTHRATKSGNSGGGYRLGFLTSGHGTVNTPRGDRANLLHQVGARQAPIAIAVSRVKFDAARRHRLNGRRESVARQRLEAP